MSPRNWRPGRFDSSHRDLDWKRARSRVHATQPATNRLSRARPKQDLAVSRPRECSPPRLERLIGSVRPAVANGRHWAGLGESPSTLRLLREASWAPRYRGLGERAAVQ